MVLDKEENPLVTQRPDSSVWGVVQGLSSRNGSWVLSVVGMRHGSRGQRHNVE